MLITSSMLVLVLSTSVKSFDSIFLSITRVAVLRIQRKL